MEVESKERIEINRVYTGEELIGKLLELKGEKLLKASDLNRINRYHIDQVIKKLEEDNVSPEIIEYIRRRVDKGWQITIGAALIPSGSQRKTSLTDFL